MFLEEKIPSISDLKASALKISFILKRGLFFFAFFFCGEGTWHELFYAWVLLMRSVDLFNITGFFKTFGMAYFFLSSELYSVLKLERSPSLF